jgi:FAD-linked oxidoreductase
MSASTENRTEKLGGNFPRRRFLQAGMAGAAASILPGCTPVPGYGPEPPAPVSFVPGQPLPWINWAGNQYCRPALLAAPTTEVDLAEILKNAKGIVRAVGAGHSFSAVVPTDDTMISTDLLAGLISHDPVTLQAEIWAGTRMHDLGPLLAGVGQALPNMPDMDYPAMGGAIANSVHATGTTFGSMSSYVVSLALVTPKGEVIECSATKNRAVFQAARTSIGALGVVSRLRLQNQAPYNLTEVSRIENTEDVLDALAENCAKYRHYEFLPLTNSDLCATVATDLARPGDTSEGEDDPEAVNKLRQVWEAVSWAPGGRAVYDRVLQLVMGGEGATRKTGPSYQVFPHVRMVRFREMEYTVPAAAGPACVREILRTVRERRIPVCFPLEYRYVKADDIWLSMFEGQDGCCISVHQYGDIDYRAYFAEIEPIFWKYQGRPHWGKIHTLDAKRLAALYPRHWQDFHDVRKSLDPQGRLLNPHLKQIFGA